MSAFFFLSDIYTETIIMSDINNKNRLRKKSAPSYSEIPSGDVHPSILGSATDTAQTSKDADANIANVTKGAKNNIKKFLNNDFPIDYNGGYKTVVIGLRQLLKLRYKGGSNYAKYQTPNGIFSFRLSDHNANGNNFENNEINISVYVAYHEYDVPESEVKYTEYKITPQLFENEPQYVVQAIVKGISKALNGESFSLDDTIATGDSFPKETLTDNNVKTEARKMNHKNTIILTETELKNVITESVKRILQEEYDMNEGRIGRALGTLALGGALAFGGNNLKAQNMNQPQSVQMQQQAQEGYTFSCPQFKSDYETILNLADKHSGADREWAKSILSNFPLDQNGAIHLEYIITCNQNLDIEQVMKTSYDWFNYSFSSAEQAVKGYDVEKGIIKARGSYLDLAQFNLNAVYYAKLVRVSADTDVILKFKDNKIKIDVIVRNYKMIMANSAMQSRNSLVAVSDVFPVNSSSDNKVAYSRAFINSYAHSMDKVKKYIEFMTENMGGSSVFYDEDDWEIEDRKQNQASQDMWDFNTPDNIKTKYFNLQRQIKDNKKNMRGLDKKSQDYITLENENNNLRGEMKKLDAQYKEITGNNIVQFEQPF